MPCLVAMYRKAVRASVANECTKLHDGIILYKQATGLYPPPTIAVPGDTATPDLDMFYERLYFAGKEKQWVGTLVAGGGGKYCMPFWYPEHPDHLNAGHEYLDPWGNPYAYYLEYEYLSEEEPDHTTRTVKHFVRFTVFSRGRNGIDETTDSTPGTGDDISSSD